MGHRTTPLSRTSPREAWATSCLALQGEKPMAAPGPTLPSAASAGHGSYQGISCRQRRSWTTVEDDPERTQPTRLGTGEPDDLRSFLMGISGNCVIISRWHRDPHSVRKQEPADCSTGSDALSLIVAVARRQCFSGYRLTNPLRFGIATFGRVSAFIASFSPITLLRARIKAVSA
jgi:hypothetical protein